jgi:hypothetical protein
MALDYFDKNKGYFANSNYQKNVANNNPQYPNGITGFEDYYTDMLGFWR